MILKSGKLVLEYIQIYLRISQDILWKFWLHGDMTYVENCEKHYWIYKQKFQQMNIT